MALSAEHLFSDTETEIVEVTKTIRGKDCLFTIEVKANYSTWREFDNEGHSCTSTEFNGYETRIFDEDRKDFPKLTKNQRAEIIQEAESKTF
jgi:hypothetical protein